MSGAVRRGYGKVKFSLATVRLGNVVLGPVMVEQGEARSVNVMWSRALQWCGKVPCCRATV